MKTFLMTLLFTLEAFAQQGLPYDNGGMSRGNHLRKPEYSTPGTGLQTYYVDGATGSDSFNCQVSTTPCATIQGAVNKIPKLLRDGVTVSIAAGNYAGFIVSGFTTETGNNQTTAGMLFDGAMVNSTLATGSATGTAAGAGQSAGSGSTYGVLCDSGATWTVNDLVGRFITTVSPANANYVISSNTATCITVVGTWTLPVAGSTTYTIQDPSVIITSGATLAPAPGTVGGSANNGGIIFQDNTITYRSPGVTVQKMRIAPPTGLGVRVGDTGGDYLLTQVQIRPTAANVVAVTVNAGAPAVALTKVDVYLSASTLDGLQMFTGTFNGQRVLWRGSASSRTPTFFGVAQSGLMRVLGWHESESRGFINGPIFQGIVWDSTLTSGNRIDCATAAGVGMTFGWTTSQLATSFGGQPTAFSPAGNTNTNITTCAVGIRAAGNVVVDFVQLTGSVATTGVDLSMGAMFSQTTASMTLTAGTNEISIDSGAVTANFADVTAGTCLANPQRGTKVCGR